MKKVNFKNILSFIKIPSVILIVFTVFLTTVGLISAKEMNIPIAINNEEEFYDRINADLSGYFVIKQQFTFSKPIKPIGDKNHPFKGMISGAGFSINGMEIDLNAYDDSHVLDGKLYTGLFPFNEGIIMDVNFGGVKFTNFDNNSSEKYKEIICGSICGRNDGKITRCFISGYNIPLTVDCDEFIFGSIAGINCGEMRLCTMPQNINISGKAKLITAGGLSGKSNGGFFDKCSRKGWILTNNLECNLTTIGCLCGESEKSRFENCCVYNGYDDNVGLNEDANSTFVLGGFVGKISGECSIVNSYSNVTIAVRNSPSTKAGFLFGCADGNAAIKNVVVNGRINIYSDGGNLIGDAGIFDSEIRFSSKNSYRVETASFFPAASEEYLKLIEIDSKVLNLNMLGWDSNIWNIQDGVINFVV